MNGTINTMIGLVGLITASGQSTVMSQLSKDHKYSSKYTLELNEGIAEQKHRMIGESASQMTVL